MSDNVVLIYREGPLNSTLHSTDLIGDRAARNGRRPSGEELIGTRLCDVVKLVANSLQRGHFVNLTLVLHIEPDDELLLVDWILECDRSRPNDGDFVDSNIDRIVSLHFEV